MEPLLGALAACMEHLARLYARVLETVRDDPVCCRLTTMPGVGPVIALTYRVAFTDSTRFVRSRAVGA